MEQDSSLPINNIANMRPLAVVPQLRQNKQTFSVMCKRCIIQEKSSQVPVAAVLVFVTRAQLPVCTGSNALKACNHMPANPSLILHYISLESFLQKKIKVTSIQI